MIRCERCSTLYELDEALLSPSGSQVQCTKCEHVFTAFPAKAPGRTEVGLPTAGEARPSEPARAPAPPPPAPAAPPQGAGAPEAAGAPTPPTERRAGAKWGTSAPIYRPPSSSPGPAAAGGSARAPLLKRDTVGVFEARLRWSARLRWLVPAAAVILLAAVAAAWLLLSRRAPADDPKARREAMALAARDDLASLDEAAARLDAALRRGPGSKAAAADGAAVDVLRAAVVAEEGEALAARRSVRAAERERLRREQPPGWEEGERAAAADVQALDREVRTREERARSLGAAALDALRPLQRAGRELPEVGRGLGLYHALEGDRSGVESAVRAARAGAPGDPWIDLAQAWVDARQADRAAQERALVALGTLAAAHPELIRGRYLLARTQAALGRRAEALASVDAVLSANARHEGAQRLRAELATPAEPPPAPQPAPAEPPPGSPAGRSPAQPRKVFSQPPAGAPAQPGGPSPAGPSGDATPAPPSQSAAPPAEGASAAPSPGVSAPAGAGGGEPAGAEAPPPRRPRMQEPEPAVDGG